MMTMEVITLSDSDDDNDNMEGTSGEPSVGATASIVCERPLQLSALFGSSAARPNPITINSVVPPSCKNGQHPPTAPIYQRIASTIAAHTSLAGANRQTVRYAPTVVPRSSGSRVMIKRPFQQISKPSCTGSRFSLPAAPSPSSVIVKKRMIKPAWNPAPAPVPHSDTHLSPALRRVIPPLPEISLNDYCYQSYDPKASTFEAQDFSSKFRCTYDGCQKLLSNNVSLMFHLWAHVVRWQSVGDDEALNDVHKLCMCPQCLHIFPTLFRLQMHYNNVHGRRNSPAACEICEITVDLKKHYLVHNGADAPYHCKKCRYRTSSRTQLLDHFVKFHKLTRTLLCPFCLLTFSVPKDVTYNVVTHRVYVAHLQNHLTSKHFKCDQCALKFVRAGDKTIHKREHTKKNPKWKSIRFKKNVRRKGRYLWARRRLLTCCECGGMEANLAEHFKGRFFCQKCPFQTCCEKSANKHKNICCSKHRCGFTRNRLLKSIVSCANCGRASSSYEILEHLLVCSNGAARVVDPPRLKPDIVAVMQEQLEVRLFALREVEGLKDDEEATEGSVQKSLLLLSTEATGISQTIEGAVHETTFAKAKFNYVTTLNSAGTISFAEVLGGPSPGFQFL